MPSHTVSNPSNWLHHIYALDVFHLATPTLIRLTRNAHVSSNICYSVPSSSLSLVLFLNNGLAHHVVPKDTLNAVAVYNILHILIESSWALILDALHCLLISVLSRGLKIIPSYSSQIFHEHLVILMLKLHSEP